MVELKSEFLRHMSVRCPDAISVQSSSDNTPNGLTVEMLRDAMLKAPPKIEEIQVGCAKRFASYVARELGQTVLTEPRPDGSFWGIPIRETRLVPENRAVGVQDGEIAFIVEF